MKVAVVGSLNMDMVCSADRMPRIGETITGKRLHLVPGGKGANQAVSCARLGACVTMLGAVGKDSFGMQMIDELRRNGVRTSCVQELNDSTGTATILHTPEDNCIVVIPGANGKYTPELLKESIQVIEEANIVLVQLEIDPSTVMYALQAARLANTTTILNPAPAEKLSSDLIREADYVTPNETELEYITGSRFETEEQLAELLSEWEDTYQNKVLLTRGSKGCSYLDEERKLVTITPPPVNVVDTTGAGDTFNGALAYGLLHHWPLHQIVRFAVSASAMSVGTFGAQGGMPTYQQVLDFQKMHTKDMEED